MIALFSPLILLQAFCLYHAYSNNQHQKWMWLIIFLPLIGCLIYMYDQFFTKRNVETIAESVQQMVTPDYFVKKAEKEVQFAGSVANKLRLGDAYMEKGKPSEALPLYESCLTDLHENDPDIFIKLIPAYYQLANYQKAVELGAKLNGHIVFKKSEARIAYAWSLHKLGRTAEAKPIFDSFDAFYCNYMQRKDYVVFLREIGETNEAKLLLSQLNKEIKEMNRNERRVNKVAVDELMRMVK